MYFVNEWKFGSELHTFNLLDAMFYSVLCSAVLKILAVVIYFFSDGESFCKELLIASVLQNLKSVKIYFVSLQ
jgi:hypothetical protein